jgi:hypothetical protein
MVLAMPAVKDCNSPSRGREAATTTQHDEKENAWESKPFEIDAKKTGEFGSFLLELSQWQRLTHPG